MALNLSWKPNDQKFLIGSGYIYAVILRVTIIFCLIRKGDNEL